MTILFAVYLVVVVALPLTLGIAVSFRNLTRESRCPMCGSDTIRITSVVARAAQLVSSRTPLQRRWCTQCSWEGYARVRFRASAPALELATVATRVPMRGCRTEPLRTLRFGGSEWRVLLQCWQERGAHYGRLVFVGPAGRLWSDAMAPFAGETRNDVVGQALSLSDGLLTYRLRDLVSD